MIYYPQEIKELEEEVASVAQSLLKRRIKWTEKEFEYLLNASLGTPTVVYLRAVHRLQDLSACVINLRFSKDAKSASAQSYHINSAKHCMRKFKAKKKLFPKPKA